MKSNLLWLWVFSQKESHKTRVRDNILKSKEQKTIQPTKGGHKMLTCQNYVSLLPNYKLPVR